MVINSNLSVSVIIAAFNVAECIERALTSAVLQSLPPLEVIVIDDVSTDATRNIVTRFAELHPSVKLVVLEENGGPGRARNAGIDVAQGDWIAVLDADDAWKHDRLKTLLEVAERRKVDFVADNQILYDSSAGSEVRVGFEADWLQRELSIEDLFRNDLADRSPLNFGLLKPLMRRSFLQEKAIRYNEAARYGEDFMLYAELLRAGGKAVLLRYPGYVYSMRNGPFSKEASKGSRTTPRFDHLVALSDAFVARHGHQLDAGTHDAIKARRRYYWTVHQSNLAREMRRSGRLAAYSIFVLTHPALLALLTSRLLKRAWPIQTIPKLNFSGSRE